MEQLGECDCLDITHKENILNALHKGINEYSIEIHNTSEAARKLRKEGNISTAELAEHSIESFKYFQNELSNTLRAVSAIKDCDRR